MNIKEKRTKLIIVIINILMIIALMTVFRACDKGMICKQTLLISLYLIIITTVVNIVAIFIKNGIANIIMQLLNIILGILQIINIKTHGLCKILTMRCHTLTKPYVIAVGVITILIALINIIQLIVREIRGNKNEACN